MSGRSMYWKVEYRRLHRGPKVKKGDWRRYGFINNATAGFSDLPCHITAITVENEHRNCFNNISGWGWLDRSQFLVICFNGDEWYYWGLGARIAAVLTCFGGTGQKPAATLSDVRLWRFSRRIEVNRSNITKARQYYQIGCTPANPPAYSRALQAIKKPIILSLVLQPLYQRDFKSWC